MYSTSHVSGRLLRVGGFWFSGLPFGKKRVATRNDLQEYDVVVAGGNLGNICASHLDARLGDKVKIIVSTDDNYQSIGTDRVIMEQGRIDRIANKFSVRGLISKNNGKADGNPIEQYLPESNEVVLKNGRKIRYNKLLIACGLKNSTQNIKGFEDAWSDLLHPFHTCQDHPTWKTIANKHMRFMYNFTGGQAIFYIPPQNYAGLVQNYNFFAAKTIFDWNAFSGKISWDHSKFTIINANSNFCQHAPNIDQFIKGECHSRNINVQYGLELVQVQKDQQTAIFRNIQTGQTQKRLYSNMYSLIPTKPQNNLQKAGLTDNAGLLDVDEHTLRHKKYHNIFGLGDCTNLKTFRSFYGGISQVAVVRHNLERVLKGQQPNAEYDGFSQAPLFTDNNRLMWVTHKYGSNNEPIQENKLLSALTYKWYLLLGKKTVANIMKFKNWGPPYFKYRKTFPDQSPKQKVQ